MQHLFHIRDDQCHPIPCVDVEYEKPLHDLLSKHAEHLFGVKILANEFVIGDRKRIDSIGIDQFGSPVILEYKAGKDSSVINQALFYTSWIDSNRAVFEALVYQSLSPAPAINWSGLRAICIAKSFSSFDALALEQMNSNLDLVTYQIYELDVIGLNTIASKRKPDFRQEQKPQRALKEFSLEDRKKSLPDVARRCLEQLLDEIKAVSHDLLVTENKSGWDLYCGDDLGQIYITEGKYPKVRIELYDSASDLSNTVRTKKTSKGVDFIVDEKTKSQAVDSLANLCARSAFGGW